MCTTSGRFKRASAVGDAPKFDAKVTVAGKPSAEGLGQAEVVISRALMEVDDRRRDHVDIVASRHQAADKLAGGDDRTAERTRGCPDGRSEEDPEPAFVHRY